MDLINKLKGTITNVITGNPVAGEFDIGPHRASGGPGLLWKIFDGVKRTTKQEVSLFVFEKKSIDRYSRRERDFIIDTLRKGVSQLTRLRHPKVLSVLHALEESRDCLAFATEPVLGSLANVLGRHDNLPNPLPSDFKDYKLYDVEIKYGLLQVTEALAFLHNDVKMVHCGVCPESIYINRLGSWKICGFDFCINNSNPQDQSAFYSFREWDGRLPPVAQTPLNYMAPEFALTMSCDPASDMFSLGCLFYAVFHGGKPLFDSMYDLSTFKKNIDSLRKLKVTALGSLPEDVRNHVKMLLNTEPTVRPDADQISKIPFFEDVGAMMLQYMDTLVQRDNLQKSQFFKGIPKILAKLPKRVNLQRVLPCMFGEASNNNMIPFVLPSIMMVAEQATEREFTKYILPGLIPIFKIQDPIQVTLLLLQNMSLLLSKTPQTDVRNHVLPMVYRALDTENSSPQIQELCLSIVPTFASLIEYSAIKSHVVPRINKLCHSTSTLNLRVRCLVTLGQLLEYMDKWYVLDEVIPMIATVPSREPAVLMSVLGIFKVAMSHKKLGITKEILANRALPYLFPLCIDNNLNLQQFNAFMVVIREMVEQVETEQRSKLEQLNTMQQEQRTLQHMATSSFPDGTATAAAVNGVEEAKPDASMMDKFLTGLGIGGITGSSGGATSKPDKTPPTRNPLNDITEVPMPKPEDNQLPNKPAKVSLTMEEKARLARDQEQHQRLKSQGALAPNTAATRVKSQPKDLTSSLMSSNLMAAPQAPHVPQASHVQQARTGGINGGMTNSSTVPAGGVGGSGVNWVGSTGMSSGVGGTMGGGMAGNNGFGGIGGGAAFGGTGGMNQSPYGTNASSNTSQPARFGSSGVPKSGSIGSGVANVNPFGGPIGNQTNKGADLSAFDSLLPSKPKTTMNQMPTVPTMPVQRFTAPPPQQQGMMGNMGMMGSGQQSMMGTGSSMGVMGGQSVMGRPGSVPTQQQGFMGQPQKQQQQHNQLSSKDIADLLG